MSQINPKEFVHNTTFSDPLPYIAGHSFEANCLIRIKQMKETIAQQTCRL